MMKNGHEATKSYRKKRPRRAKFKKRKKIECASAVRPVSYRPLNKSCRNSASSRFRKLSSKQDWIRAYMPHNLLYIINNEKSPFYIKRLKLDSTVHSDNGTIRIPQIFSLSDNSKDTVNALKAIIKSLLIEDNASINLDYSECKKVDLGAQALLDVVLMEYRRFYIKCSRSNHFIKNFRFPYSFGGCNINDDNLKKLMFSVGSPANLGIRSRDFPDVIRYAMCSRNMLTANDRTNLAAQKELDTTEMIDYVVACLEKMNRKLTPEKLNDLSVVIGEMLINAEEHSTLHHRFSMGYFQETKENNKHFGLFKLVILNFGGTIYEKFKNNDECPQNTIERMRKLSENYTKRQFFRKREFEEDTLWTLYALQQGVTSVAGKRRGNGTIQFIKSFFNIKGNPDVDSISKMIIISGNTQIVFDGTYGITERDDGGRHYDMMTFNTSGSIEDCPDPNFVKTSELYFPGTIISANILLNDDDVKLIN